MNRIIIDYLSSQLFIRCNTIKGKVQRPVRNIFHEIPDQRPRAFFGRKKIHRMGVPEHAGFGAGTVTIRKRKTPQGQKSRRVPPRDQGDGRFNDQPEESRRRGGALRVKPLKHAG